MWQLLLWIGDILKCTHCGMNEGNICIDKIEMIYSINVLIASQNKVPVRREQLYLHTWMVVVKQIVFFLFWRHQISDDGSGQCCHFPPDGAMRQTWLCFLCADKEPLSSMILFSQVVTSEKCHSWSHGGSWSSSWSSNLLSDNIFHIVGFFFTEILYCSKIWGCSYHF